MISYSLNEWSHHTSSLRGGNPTLTLSFTNRHHLSWLKRGGNPTCHHHLHHNLWLRRGGNPTCHHHSSSLLVWSHHVWSLRGGNPTSPSFLVNRGRLHLPGTRGGNPTSPASLNHRGRLYLPGTRGGNPTSPASTSNRGRRHWRHRGHWRLEWAVRIRSHHLRGGNPTGGGL